MKTAVAIVSIITLVVLAGIIALLALLIRAAATTTTPGGGDIILAAVGWALCPPFLGAPAGVLAAVDAARTRHGGWLVGLIVVTLVAFAPLAVGPIVSQAELLVQNGVPGEMAFYGAAVAAVALVLAPPFISPVAALLYLLVTRQGKPTTAPSLPINTGVRASVSSSAGSYERRADSMRAVSIVSSVVGCLLVLVLVASIAPYAFDPQTEVRLASNPGVNGLSPAVSALALACGGYPVCLVGAGFAFVLTLQQHRRWLATALAGISLLAVVAGLVGVFWPVIDAVPATVVFLMGVPLLVPVASVVVVAIVAFRPAQARPA